jgi:hypothetical protein
MLKGSMVAENAQLELNLKHTKAAFHKRVSNSLSKGSIHGSLGFFILLSLFFSEFELTKPVHAIRQIEQFFRAPQAGRI